jgi:hypothetical protein
MFRVKLRSYWSRISRETLKLKNNANKDRRCDAICRAVPERVRPHRAPKTEGPLATRR